MLQRPLHLPRAVASRRPRGRSRRLLRTLAAVLLSAPLLPAAPAHADAGAKVTWTVQPADGRRWIERTLDPGQKVTENLTVRNLGTVDTVFALSAADGYLTENGHFTMLSSDRKSSDGGTWISVQPSVAVAAGKTRIVPFTITVPAAATPGDHPAGIAASVLSRSGTVQVESRVGFRVLLRASGTARASLAASALNVSYHRSWNPFRSGTIQLAYTATNTGNIRAEARAAVAVTELFGAYRRTTGADAGELLPGGTRATTGQVGGLWGLGPLHTTITLTPAALNATPTTTAATIWIVPWPQLLAVALLIALVFLVRARRRVSRRRLAQMLEAARREGQASA